MSHSIISIHIHIPKIQNKSIHSSVAYLEELPREEESPREEAPPRAGGGRAAVGDESPTALAGCEQMIGLSYSMKKTRCSRQGSVVGIIAEEEIIFGRTLEDGVDVADVDDGLERRWLLRVVGEDESLASLLG